MICSRNVSWLVTLVSVNVIGHNGRERITSPTLIVKVRQLSGNVETTRRTEPPSLSSIRRGGCGGGSGGGSMVDSGGRGDGGAAAAAVVCLAVRVRGRPGG